MRFVVIIKIVKRGKTALIMKTRAKGFIRVKAKEGDAFRDNLYGIRKGVRSDIGMVIT